MDKNREGFRPSTIATHHAEVILSLLLQSDDEEPQNDSDLMRWNSESFNNNGSLLRSRPTMPIETLTSTINHLIIPIVCLIGILGNGFNFYVFYCRWYQKFMNDAEKSVTVGLMTLALSDAMFCLAAVPALFLYAPLAPGAQTVSVFSLHYKVYRPFFSNLFLLNSTWLIVTVSVQRLVAVSSWSTRCRDCVTDPLKTAVVHGAIFLAAFLVCFPLLLRNSVIRDVCDASLCYYILPSEMLNSTPFVAAYQVFWAVFGTLLPLVLLTFSNVRLIAVLCHGRYSEGLEASERRHRTKITVLVLAMIVSFLLLVCPSMIVECLIWMVKHKTGRPLAAVAVHGPRLMVAGTVTNLLQAVKFSFDFLLYCSVSKQFRREFKGCSRVNDSCRTNRADQGGPERCRLDGGKR